MFQRKIQIQKLEEEIDRLLASDLEPEKLDNLLDELEVLLATEYKGLRLVE